MSVSLNGLPTIAEIRDRYEEAFKGEPLDAAWSDSAEHIAEDRLKVTVPQGSELLAIRCKTSICRIETSHPDRAHFDKFVETSFKNPTSSLWNGATFSSILGDCSAAPLRVVSYVAREGRALPAVAID